MCKAPVPATGFFETKNLVSNQVLYVSGCTLDSTLVMFFFLMVFRMIMVFFFFVLFRLVRVKAGMMLLVLVMLLLFVMFGMLMLFAALRAGGSP